MVKTGQLDDAQRAENEESYIDDAQFEDATGFELADDGQSFSSSRSRRASQRSQRTDVAGSPDQ